MGLVVALAFWAYRLLAVPFIEPTAKAPAPSLAQTRGSAGRGQPENLQELQVRELARWFKPDDWPLRKKPKVLENSRGKLLLDEYTTLPDGRVRVKPCAMVFLPDRETASEEERLRQAVILEAPEGAILEFDQPFELTRGSVGKLVAGTLQGAITIRSDYREPGPADDLLIETRDVDLDADSITTGSPIKFRFGDTRGSGRGMKIELLSDTAQTNRYGPQISGVKSLTLLRNVQVRMMVNGGSENAFSGRGPEKATLADGKPAAQTPLEVSCRGPFHFDAEENFCTFEEHVDVLRIRRNGPGDQLACQLLKILFERVNAGAADSDSNTAGEGKLQAKRLEARGDPVTIRSPIDQVAGRCQALDYIVATRQVHLIGTSANVELEREDKVVVARELHYEPGETGRIGRIKAVGPGRLTGNSPDDPTKNFEVRWAKELLSYPVETEQLVTIDQDAYASSPGTGSLAADQIHLWFKESPDAPRGELPANGADGVTPRRLLAQGHVRFDSSQLTGTTDKLETWFTQVDVARPPQAGYPRPGHAVRIVAYEARPSREQSPQPAQIRERRRVGPGESSQSTLIPVQYREVQPEAAAAQPTPASAAANPSAGPTLAQPGAAAPAAPPAAPRSARAVPVGDPNQRFEVSGRLLQIQVRLSGATSELTEALVDGMARFAEVESPQASEKPLLVQGDRLHVVRLTPTATAVAVTGKPARVDGRGLSMHGDEINLNQQTNRLWIDGPGGLSLLVDQDKQGHAEGPRQLDVTWRGKMRFDGQQAIFEHKVEANRPNQLLKTANLEVNFDKRVDFVETKQEARPQVKSVHCRQGVEGVSQTFDERGLLTIERLNTADLMVNQISGELAAQGPGWITRVTRGPPASEATLPNLNAANAAKEPTAKDRDGLNYMHVRFQKGMSGNIHRKQVRFDEQVKAIYGPVAAWNSVIDPDADGGLGPESALLTCDRLEAMQMPGVGGSEPHMELDASENAFVEGQTYTARANRITYNQAKDLMVLEGAGRVAAELSQQQRVGGPVKNLAANKIKYWKSSNHVQVDDARFLDLGQLPQGKPGRK
ncbi:MAG: hypothetical protein AB7O62_00480 [Pirellulales bacterium]